MKRSKLPFLSVVFMLITVVIFMAGPEAQDSEENDTPLQEFVSRAQTLVRRNQLEEAIEIYERIVIAVPEDYESRSQLAMLYACTNQHDKAAQTYSELLKIYSENPKYQDGLVRSLQAAGKLDEAFDLAQSYIQSYPTMGVHYARLARLYEVDGNEAAAITNYNKAVELAHDDRRTYLSLARLNFFHEDINAAEIALKNAILSATSASDRQDVELQLISFYRYHGNLEKKLQQAENDGTITYEMQKALAEYYYKTGEPEKAANAYKRALDITTSSYQKDRIITELLKIYVQLGDMDSVIEPYQTEMNSYTNSKIWFYTSERITVTSARIAATYNFETVRNSLIDAFQGQDKLEVLKTYYEGKLEENKDNLVVLTVLARVYWVERDYQKAAEMYEALGKAEPNDVRYFYYAAAALKKTDSLN